MSVAESLCWRQFSLCWWYSQCIKSVTNISNLSPTHLVSNIRHQHQCNQNGGLILVFKKLWPKFPISNLKPMFEEDAVLFWWVTWSILVAIPTPVNIASLEENNAECKEMTMNTMKCHFIFMMERAIHSRVKQKFYFVSALTDYPMLMAAICKFSIKT